MHSRLSALVKETDPEATKERKWNTPVWSHPGIICTGETCTCTVKMTVAKGASVAEEAGASFMDARRGLL